MIRFLPARHYLSFGIIGLFLAVFSGWLGLSWTPAFLPCGLFLVTSILLILLAYWPGIEVHPQHLVLGSRVIHWVDIRRVDRTRFLSPLIVRVTLFDDSQALLIYPGDPEACRNLLRHVRRSSRDALFRTVSTGVKPSPTAASVRCSLALACSERKTKPKSSVCTSA